LISWNVDGRYGRALAAHLYVVGGRSPDLVALQEVARKAATAGGKRWPLRVCSPSSSSSVDGSASLMTRA
jgi:hypothetical protein